MKSNIGNCIAIVLVIFFYSEVSFAQNELLRTEIAGIIAEANGQVGVAIEGLENGDTLTFNNNYHYPMQSVFKFPLALAVLSEVDKGSFSLDQKIYINKTDLLPNTWSPLREKYPNGNIDLPLSELLNYTVAVSDNNGCDILLRLIGGPAKVNQFVHNLGITDMQIVLTEEEMHKEWQAQYKNWSTPAAMAQLLTKFFRNSFLSETSRDFLWNIMASANTGLKRIKGNLPEGTIVAHKTGSSGTNDDGIAAATNDVGIVMLPNGKGFAIVVFVSDSPDDEITRDKIIADITKAVWDAYLSH
ncbi:MAG: class A beta-lactamase, subclass A2 [Ignavibacteriaceae bacterium]|nr:class A beta-lactamase, subclass A2 [Ignavibacteriaceae bacterium]